MANTSRRVIDNNGNQFIPMNLEGSTWNEHFITSTKFIMIICMGITALLVLLYLTDGRHNWIEWVVFMGGHFLISLYITRYVIFEEKFYFRMYRQLEKYEVCTPALFWNISSVSDTLDGAIITYSDTRVGVVVRLERDTITGKHVDFEEQHFDAISDFYKQLVTYGYSFVQMNIMESAGNDPRFENLEMLVNKSDNPSIQELMEKEIGYIKTITIL